MSTRTVTASPAATSLAAPYVFSRTIPHPTIVGAVPVIRRAILLRHTPPLVDQQAKAAAELLQAAWPVWCGEYVSAMARIAGVSSRHITVAEHESVRHRYDGKTPMIDLPRLRTRGGATSEFDLRHCVALCTDQFSSKVWTRIGPPEGAAGASPNRLRQLARHFRQQAFDSGEWFYQEFLRISRGALSGPRRTRNAESLEVTTVGLRIRADLSDAEFDAWLFADDSANLANDELRKFLAAAADVPVEDVGAFNSDTYWVSVPAAIQDAAGVLASRRVLYMVRQTSEGVQAVGIGLDDSGSGDLANDVALKFSRQIANAI